MIEKPKAIETTEGVREFMYPAASMNAYLKEQAEQKDALLRFFRHYAVLDGEQRRGVCATINEQPIAWRMAYREISHQTELGARILKELDEKKVL